MKQPSCSFQLLSTTRPNAPLVPTWIGLGMRLGLGLHSKHGARAHQRRPRGELAQRLAHRGA